MKSVVIFLMIVVTLGLSNFATGAVLLDETFVDPNLIGWTKLDTPTGGATVNVGLYSNNSLLVGVSPNNGLERYQGLMSDDSYAVPVGETLVVDFYGVNRYEDFWDLIGTQHNSKRSVPLWLVSANDYSADGFVSDAPQSAVGMRGRDMRWQWDDPDYPYDYVYSNTTGGGTYTPVGVETLAAGVYDIPKHVIITINASETKLYIEDDYYENLSNPTALKTIATSDIFSPAQLASGLHVYLLAARQLVADAYYTGELFNDVRVSRILTPIPADCAEVISMGGGLTGDINSDCSVDFKDFSELGQLWLDCVDPQDVLCDSPWGI